MTRAKKPAAKQPPTPEIKEVVEVPQTVPINVESLKAMALQFNNMGRQATKLAAACNQQVEGIEVVLQQHNQMVQQQLQPQENNGPKK